MVPFVLSIDDDQSCQLLMKAFLTDENFYEKFERKVNGQDAIDYISDQIAETTTPNLPELIFLDINMPILDGWGFLAQLEKLKQEFDYDPVIVMISATTAIDDLQRAADHPLVCCLVKKPLNAETIRNIAEHPALSQYFAARQSCSSVAASC